MIRCVFFFVLRVLELWLFLIFERINTVNGIDAKQFHTNIDNNKKHTRFSEIFFRLEYRNSSLKPIYVHNQALNRILPLSISLQCSTSDLNTSSAYLKTTTLCHIKKKEKNGLFCGWVWGENEKRYFTKSVNIFANHSGFFSSSPTAGSFLVLSVSMFISHSMLNIVRKEWRVEH